MSSVSDDDVFAAALRKSAAEEARLREEELLNKDYTDKVFWLRKAGVSEARIAAMTERERWRQLTLTVGLHLQDHLITLVEKFNVSPETILKSRPKKNDGTYGPYPRTYGKEMITFYEARAKKLESGDANADNTEPAEPKSGEGVPVKVENASEGGQGASTDNTATDAGHPSGAVPPFTPEKPGIKRKAENGTDTGANGSTRSGKPRK